MPSKTGFRHQASKIPWQIARSWRERPRAACPRASGHEMHWQDRIWALRGLKQMESEMCADPIDRAGQMELQDGKVGALSAEAPGVGMKSGLRL